MIALRAVTETDLAVFFAHQREPAANAMAVFPGREHDAFMTHWRTKILADDAVIKRTVLCDYRVAGNIVSYEESGKRLVGYWIGEEFWGRGVATAALMHFVTEIEERPLHAFVATRNVGSIRVLEKCGFARVGEQLGCHGDDDVPVFVYELRA